MFEGRIGKEPLLLTVNTPQIESFTLSNPSAASINDHLADMDISLIYWQSADNVTMGLYKDGHLHFHRYDPQWIHLQTLRVFNKNAELYVWKTGTQYRGRLIKNERQSESGADCLEQYVKLWGTKCDNDGNVLVLSEERGMEIPLFGHGKSNLSSGVNAFLRERLYIRYDEESGCAYFADRRFCWIYFMNATNQLDEMAVSI